MGSWNETCGFSQHSIIYGENVYGIVILGNPKSHKSCYSSGVSKPMSLIIEGEYNDYGSIEKIKPSFSASMLIHTMNELYKTKKLIISDRAVEDFKSNTNSNYGVTGFDVNEGFSDCETIFYCIEREYVHITDHDYNADLKKYPLFFMMMKKDVLDIAVNVLNKTNDYDHEDIINNKVADDVSMLYSEIFDNMDSDRIAELDKILGDENSTKEELEEAGKIHYRLMKSSFEMWGGDSLKSKHSQWSNHLNMLRGHDFVDTKSFGIMYTELMNNFRVYDKEEVISSLTQFLLVYYTFDLFRKIWTPQGHSSQYDNFKAELQYTEQLLRYMYEERKQKIARGYYDDDDYVEVIGAVSIFEDEIKEEG